MKAGPEHVILEKFEEEIELRRAGERRSAGQRVRHGSEGPLH